MIHRSLAVMLTLGILAWADAAPAEDEQQEREGADDLDVTMRVIENPDAVSPEAITRRLSLPEPRGKDGRGVAPQDTPADGPEVSEMAREKGREFGEEVAEQAREQAREQAEQAKEQREEFGRSRAEELRPDPPERPDTDPPAPPRPDGR